MSSRGIYTSVNHIRKKVYAEVAKLSYEYQEGSLNEMEHVAYRIIPGEISTYRESVFLERAIVNERMRLALGLDLRSAAEQSPVSIGAEECIKPETYYKPPLINIIKFACNACPDNKVVVSDLCQGCLAHPCKEICPKKAISIKNGKSHIDQDLCIKCDQCVNVCPYNAINHLKRPCSEACGMNAIHSDQYGRAEIDQEKCVNCGMCLANCPFGAIADKAQIFQTIQAIRSDTPVYAALAPSAIGQFGNDLPLNKLRPAFQALGFKDIVEVAIGADLCTLQEAEMFVKEVPEEIPFMATSCCPSWSMMAKKEFPEISNCVSMALTPMVLIGRLMKVKHPDCKVAFIGPCSAKKLEAMRESVRSDIDFVLTFEEVMGMFETKNINFKDIEAEHSMHGASGDGRGFASSGGVADAVSNVIKDRHPEIDLKMEKVEGLANCRKMLQLAKTGKYNGYLLEGMACPGGCIGGAGTLLPINKAKTIVQNNKKNSTHAHSFESNYEEFLDEITNE